MKLKVDPVTVLIVIGLLLSHTGVFIAGWKASPKEIIDITEVESNQRTTIDSSQTTDVMNGNVTIIFEDGFTNKIINIQVDNLTNVTVVNLTNEQTNYAITNGG